MDKLKFDAADPLVDEIAEMLDELLSSQQAEALKAKLTELSNALGAGYSVSLDCRLEVQEPQRQRSLPLLSTGFSVFHGKEPYRAWGDSTPQRYLAKGEVVVVPHDHCPCCWGKWDFKFRNPRCNECGAALGKEVKVLLDTDVCPWCEKGEVSMAQQTCEQCGFEINPDWVHWG